MKRKYDSKTIAQKWNTHRIQKIGQECCHSDVLQALKICGLPYPHSMVTLLIKYNVIKRSGERRWAKFFFTEEPIHFSKFENVLKEYKKSKRPNKQECSFNQEQPVGLQVVCSRVTIKPYWVSTNSWEV